MRTFAVFANGSAPPPDPTPNERPQDGRLYRGCREAVPLVCSRGWHGDRYLDTVQATCQLLSRHPFLGPEGGFAHPRLREWRFYPALRPFNKHVLFYEILSGEVVMRRAMHGHRDLQRRLLEASGAD